MPAMSRTIGAYMVPVATVLASHVPLRRRLKHCLAYYRHRTPIWASLGRRCERVGRRCARDSPPEMPQGLTYQRTPNGGQTEGVILFPSVPFQAPLAFDTLQKKPHFRLHSCRRLLRFIYSHCFGAYGPSHSLLLISQQTSTR
jgi:hypothetical protein